MRLLTNSRFIKTSALFYIIAIFMILSQPPLVYPATTLSFASPVTYSVGNRPSMVVVADFNGDNKLDLVSANSSSNNVSVLLGNGNGTFQGAVNYPIGVSPLALAFGDFNKDGKLDLVTANAAPNNVSVLLGNGSGGFGSPTQFPVGSLPYSVAVSDFNGDNNLDLVTANSSDNNVTVLLGNGNGSFGTPAPYSVGSNPQSVKVADFNGDNKPDLVTSNYNGNNLSVLLNNGSGGFNATINYTVGSNPTQVVVDDFNGDSKPDLVSSNFGSANTSLLLNNGSGGFNSAVNYSSNQTALASGDFNQDAKPDLVTTNLYSTNLTVLPNNGIGGFGPSTTFPVGATPYSVAVGDFNGDNKPDIVTANNTANNLSVILNTTVAPSKVIAASDGTPQSTSGGTAFNTSFKASVKDLANNPLVGVSVTFVAPASGASGTFASSGTSVTVITDGSGTATAPTFTANCQLGSFRVSADVNGAATQAYFFLANTVGSPASIVANAGTPQNAVHDTPFASPLKALVRDTCNNPVSGVNVNFVAPNSGVSGTFPGGLSNITLTTDSSGIATSPTFTANSILGSYTVAANVIGFPIAGTASFNLTNKAGPASSITVSSGTHQSTIVGTVFSSSLVAIVKDAGGYPVGGVGVTFQAPTIGASGSFSGGGSSITAITNASGLATASTFTANCQAGSYTVTAMVSGVNTPANFSLTNTGSNPASIIAKAGNGQRAVINTVYATSMKALVRDTCGNPLSGFNVNFSAPSTGASGSFPGATTNTTVSTDATGIAVAPIFTANGVTGTYTVTATLIGFPVAGTVNFNLNNLPADIGSLATTAYQINPAHTGALSMPGFGPQLQQKWSVDLGGTIDFAIVAENKVYAISRLGGTNLLKFYGVSVPTGQIAFGPVSDFVGYSFYKVGLAYENGKVVILNDASFWSRDAATGNSLWSTRQPNSQIWSFGPPTILNGIAYNSGTGSGGLNAIRMSDGVTLWSVNTADGNNTSPTVTDDGVYVVTNCPSKYDPVSGALLWSYTVTCANGATTPVVYNNRVYIPIAGTNGLVLDSSTGQLLTGVVKGTTPAFDNGVGFYVYNGSLQAKNANTDASLWSASVNGQTLSTPPIVINGVVYVGTDSAAGDIYAFNAATGNQVWHGTAGFPLSGSLTAHDGVLVAPASTHLVAFDTAVPAPGYDSTPAPGSTISFGNTPLGIPISTTITINESGNLDLTVSNPVLVGSNLTDFSFSGLTFPFTIPDGGVSKTLTITCTPSHSGTRTATLTLTTNDPARTSVNYNLTCTGTTVVINAVDDGAGTTPGSLSYYFVSSRLNLGDTISFALNGTTTMNVTGPLPVVPVGVIIDGGSCSNGNPGITLDGTNAGNSTTGLILGGQNFIKNLKITKFKNRQLVTNGPGNHLLCVVAQH